MSTQYASNARHSTEQPYTGLFSVSMSPMIRPDVVLPHCIPAKSVLYVTTLARCGTTQSGRQNIESRPCLSILSIKAWPFSYVKVKLENGNRVAKASAWKFTPVGFKELKTMYKAFKKAGIELSTHEGEELPEHYNMEKTARNISKSVVSRYKQPNEFVVCQKLEI